MRTRNKRNGPSLSRVSGVGVALAVAVTVAIAAPAYACDKGGDPPATVTLSSSAPEGLVTGEAVTFTATVTASPGPPFTGSIVFGVVGSQGAVATCDGGDTQPLSTTDGVTTAVCSFADGLPGKQLSYTVSANLVDPHYTAPTATLVQRINKSLTETTISGLVGSVIAGESFTFTAAVQDVAPGTGSPTGVMQFALCPENRPPPCTGYPSGASQLPTPTPQQQALNENQITFSLPSGVLKPGLYEVSAIYVGDSNYRSSPSPLSNFRVEKVPTTLALVASRNPAFDGGRLVIRAIITPDPRATSSLSGPSGEVTFTITGSSGDTLDCIQTGTPVIQVGTSLANQGLARCGVTGEISAADSPYTVTATYSGDSVYVHSTQSGGFTVIPS
jgi:hypothetical protein